MWWYYIKKHEDKDKVMYSYGKETKIVSGELLYDKRYGKYSVIKAAENDTEKGAKWALSHLVDVVKEGLPNERMVAIG